MPIQHATRGFATWYVALLTVTLALGGALAYTGVQSLTPLPVVDVAPVVLATAQPQLAEQSEAVRVEPGPSVAVQAPGWLEADPYFVAASALAGGVVDEILVLEGDAVEAGQVVATMIDDDARLEVGHARAAHGVARASVAVAEARLNAAQATWDEPVERLRSVATTSANVAELRAELAQLPALIVKEEALAEKQREEFERAKDAFESGAASETELIVAKQEFEAQKATVASTRLREPILTNKITKLEAEHEAAVRNAELRIEEREALDAARAGLAKAHADEQLAQAALDTAQLRLDRMTIYAPISGYVQRRLKVPGDKAMLDMDEPHSAHIVHLYDPAKLQVRVDVPLADASNIAVGQSCEVVVDVLPDETFQGVVTRITHEADLQKNTLQAKVRVLDPSPLLRPEMLTRVRFLPASGSKGTTSDTTTPNESAFLVPEAAIDRSSGSTLWVIRNRRQNSGSASPITVETSETRDGWTRVTGPLLPTDLVVLQPSRLNPGDRVRLMTVSERGDQ